MPDVAPDAARDAAPRTPTQASRHPVLIYSLLRLGILAGSLALVFLLGLRGWWWLLASAVVAGAVSYLALPRQRRAATQVLAEREATARATRIAGDDDAAAEDAVLDADASPGAASTGLAGSAAAASVRSAAEAASPDHAGRSAPPESEGERERHHELEPSDVPQHGDQPRS